MTVDKIKQKLSTMSFTPSYSILMHKLGVDRAVVYGELLNKYMYLSTTNQLTDDGFFFYTVNDLEYETSIPRKTQYRIMKELEEKGLIKTEQRGVPRVRYIKVITDDDVLEELIRDTRVKAEPKPMPKEVKEKYVKPFDMNILKKQIEKVSKDLGVRKGLSNELYDMYHKLFDRVGYPCSGLSTKSIKSCMERLERLDYEYDIIDYFDDYLNEYEMLPYKKGHDLGMSNLLTDEMLEILQQRIN